MKDKKIKREMIQKKQLELLAKGIKVFQYQLEDDYVPNDEIILEQIESLKELRDNHPRLSRAINEDLNVLLTNQNYVTIKQFNEQNTLIRNDIENEYINILYFDYILSNSKLTSKQKQMIYDYYTGNIHSDKNLKNAFDKIKNFMERENMAKELMNEKALKRLFPSYFSKSEDYFDNYLNMSVKLDIYTRAVEQSKIEGDRIRALSLSYSILPVNLNEE